MMSEFIIVPIVKLEQFFAPNEPVALNADSRSATFLWTELFLRILHKFILRL